MKMFKRALSISIAGLVLAATWPSLAFAALEGETAAAAAPRVVAAPAALPSLNTPLPGSVSVSALTQSPEASLPAPVNAQAAQSPLPAAPSAVPAAPAAALGAPAALPQAGASAQAAARPSASGSAARQTPEQASLDSARTFDGAFGPVSGQLVARPDWARLAVHKLLTHPAVQSRLPAPVAALGPVQNGQKAPAPRIVLKTTDEFGGPNALPMTLRQRIGYGLKWGVNLIGISVLMKLVLGTVIAAAAWQLHLPPSTLHSMGRVELLTHFGPAQIAQMLHMAPARFFSQVLPLTTALEEVSFRLGYFVLPFLALAAIKPIAQALSKGAGALADPLGWRKGMQKALVWASKLSVAAFPLAALYSAHKFAVAHFAAWGAHPYTYLLHGALGYALAYVLYRSRSLVSPFVAHLTYNFIVIALSFLLPAPIQLLAASLSVVALFWNWRVHRKALAAAYAQAKADAGVKGMDSGKLKILLLTAALLAGSTLGIGMRARPDASFRRPTATVQTQQQAPQQQAPQQAAPQSGDPQAGQAQLPQELQDLLSQAAADQPAAKPDLSGEQVVAKVMPSVIKITVRMTNGMAIGSGYIVTPDGLAFTNAHVVVNAGLNGIVEVDLDNHLKGHAKVVALNTDKDIALVQLAPLPGGKKWPALTLADSDKVVRGQRVFALGNPLGLSFRATAGIISGLADSQESLYVQYFQTDAEINHGNSGGPLVNAQGEVVGMNSWIIPEGRGMGFSIVSNDIKTALDQYQATGNINSAWLGLIVDAERASLPDRGVTIEQIRPGSPAAKAGLRPGDVIVGINGESFPDGGEESLTALAKVLAVSKPGDKLTFNVDRDGSEVSVDVTMGDKQPPLAPGAAKSAAPAPQKKP